MTVAAQMRVPVRGFTLKRPLTLLFRTDFFLGVLDPVCITQPNRTTNQSDGSSYCPFHVAFSLPIRRNLTGKEFPPAEDTSKL